MPYRQQPTRAVEFTEEEALALLEICLHSKTEDDPLKAKVMDKVADLCREFIKAGAHGSAGRHMQTDRMLAREALDSLLQRRQAPERARA